MESSTIVKTIFLEKIRIFTDRLETAYLEYEILYHLKFKSRRRGG